MVIAIRGMEAKMARDNGRPLSEAETELLNFLQRKAQVFNCYMQHLYLYSLLKVTGEWFPVRCCSALVCFFSFLPFGAAASSPNPPAKLPLSLTLRAGAPVGVKFAGAAHDVGAHARGGKGPWPPNG